MNHKIPLIFMGILISSIILTPGPASADVPRYLHVTSITMELDGPDATFTVNYELDVIARLYVLFLGSGSIKPAINEFFYDFDDIQITSIRDDHAVVVAKDVSYKDPEQMGNMYFYDSHDLGTRVDTLKVVFPSGVSRTFSNVSATPNTFFEAK